MKVPPTGSVQAAEGLHYDIPGYHIRQSWCDSQDDPESVGYPDH